MFVKLTNSAWAVATLHAGAVRITVKERWSGREPGQPRGSLALGAAIGQEYVNAPVDVCLGCFRPARSGPRETVVDGLNRILAQGFDYSDAEITGFLGIVETDDSATRTFVFTISTIQPDSGCLDGRIPHRWIDNITMLSASAKA